MQRHRMSGVVIGLLILMQLCGPAVMWAAEQRGVRVEANRRTLVSGLNGPSLFARGEAGSLPLQFRETVPMGAMLTTDAQTIAEVLIGNRAVITLGPNTAAQLTTVTAEQTTLSVAQGHVRVAAAPSGLGEQGLVTLQTPMGEVQTRGGIVRVVVEAPTGTAEVLPPGAARLYRASYQPEVQVAARPPQSGVVLVEEGTAEVRGTAMPNGFVSIPAGQTLHIQGGQVGPLTAVASSGEALRTGLLASSGHSQTPKEGLDNLVAFQVEQANKLGQALTGAAETEGGQSSSGDQSKNALNGATGGVALASGGLLNALFGVGTTPNSETAGVANTSGTGYGGHNNNGFHIFPAGAGVQINGGDKALLVYTRMDPVDKNLNPISSIATQVSVSSELVLIGGVFDYGHGGIAPTERLIVRGLESGGISSIYPYDSYPGGVRYGGGEIPAAGVVDHNSTFVVKSGSSVSLQGAVVSNEPEMAIFSGGTLGQFSSRLDNVAFIRSSRFDSGSSFVRGAITAAGADVTLTGGVILDQGTKATVGQTAATNSYFQGHFQDTSVKDLLANLGETFTGSLLSVISGPNDSATGLTMQDRMLGVYDGSVIQSDGNGNKALLSVLDAKLKGPGSSIPLIDIATGSHFAVDPNEPVVAGTPRTITTTPGSEPSVKVTSAVVVRSTVPLDGALLEASAPILALTNATMTTTSHFADLAGNASQAMVLNNANNALVALNASTMLVERNLLNLNSATATINGYLFSLNNGSTLTLKNGALFSLNNGSTLNLNGNAFGVFGSGANTLSITNNMCAGAGTCGQLFTSANTPFILPNGTPLKVAGTTQNVVLPSSFNVFAVGGTNAQPNVVMTPNDALFHIDEKSTLTINNVKVK